MLTLKFISNWTYHCKFQFNYHPKKEANEVTFSGKSNTNMYPPVTLSNNITTKCLHQELMRVVPNSKIDKQKIKKCNKITELIKRLSISLKKNIFSWYLQTFCQASLSTTVIFCMTN